jgi:hypothetical protein
MSVIYKNDPRANKKEQDDSVELMEVTLSDDAGSEDEDTITETIDSDDDSGQVDLEGGHFENLAYSLPNSVLSRLAGDLIDDVEADKESMTEWRETLSRGLQVMGLKEIPTSALPFEGANTSSYPLLIESVIQFNARAMKETLPADGAVKCKIIGKANEEAEAAALRVEKHMNMQITFDDTGYFDNHDKTLMYLPYAGSAFKKTYRDTVKGVTVSRFIPAESILVNYHATCDEDLERITHVIDMSHQQYLRLVASGQFCDKAEHRLTDTSIKGDEEELTVSIKETEKRDNVTSTRDNAHTIYEVYCYYDLAGYEHKGEDGKPSGIALPYVVTIDKDSQKVLAVRRNWEERLDHITHYRYLPSFGYLGWGLLHVIGQLARGVNGLQRLTIDGAVMASFQGGFAAKNSKMKKGAYQLKPYEWQVTDCDYEELQKTFWNPTFKEPSPVLNQMMTALVEAGRRIASTTETVVGDANNNAPVGTTIALIEQATKVMSGIHVRLHNAMAHEFMVRARINALYLEDQPLHFDADGDSGYIIAGDYGKSIKLIPVSDPNIVSQTQRIALAQGQLTLAQQFPQMHDMYEALQRMHKAMGTQDIDDLLIDPDKVPYLDPMAEGARIVAGKPIRAFVTQEHDAHKAVHGAQLQYLQQNMGQEAQPILMALQAHIAEHDAYKMYIAMGGQDTEFNIHAKEVDEASLDKQTEYQLSIIEAQNMQQFMQMLAQEAGGEPSEEEKAQGEFQAKMQMEQAAFEAEQQRKQVEFQAEEERKQIAFDAEQARKNGVARDMVVDEIKQRADEHNANRFADAVMQSGGME